jgi:CheY-like chemotaxis protein
MQEVRKAPVVLCVDDNPSVLSLLEIALEGEGYSVLTATNGQAALKIFMEQAIDAVVLDYKMPGMNGVQVAWEMKRINPQVPKVMFSSSSGTPAQAAEVIEVFCPKAGGVISLVSHIQRLLAAAEPASSRTMSVHTHFAIARLGVDWDRESRKLATCNSPTSAS